MVLHGEAGFGVAGKACRGGCEAVPGEARQARLVVERLVGAWLDRHVGGRLSGVALVASLWTFLALQRSLGDVGSLAEYFGAFGAEIVRMLLAVGWLAGAVWTGAAAYQWSGRRVIGWTAGAGAAVALALMLLPAHHALLEVSCRQTADFATCMDGD